MAARAHAVWLHGVLDEPDRIGLDHGLRCGALQPRALSVGKLLRRGAAGARAADGPRWALLRRHRLRHRDHPTRARGAARAARAEGPPRPALWQQQQQRRQWQVWRGLAGIAVHGCHAAPRLVRGGRHRRCRCSTCAPPYSSALSCLIVACTRFRSATLALLTRVASVLPAFRGAGCGLARATTTAARRPTIGSSR